MRSHEVAKRHFYSKMVALSTTPRLCCLSKSYQTKCAFSLSSLLSLSDSPSDLEGLIPRCIGDDFPISFPSLCIKSTSLQISLGQKYLLFWLMSEHQENTKVVKGLVVNKMLAFPLRKQKQNHLNDHSTLQHHSPRSERWLRCVLSP